MENDIVRRTGYKKKLCNDRTTDHVASMEG